METKIVCPVKITPMVILISCLIMYCLYYKSFLLQHAQIFRVTTSLLLRTLAWIRRLIELLIQSPRINIGSISSIFKLNITFYNICNWLTLIIFLLIGSVLPKPWYITFFLYSPPCTWSMRYSCIYSFSQWEFPCFLSLIIYKKSIDNSSQFK